MIHGLEFLVVSLRYLTILFETFFGMVDNASEGKIISDCEISVI
jgi:hypothetical protein